MDDMETEARRRGVGYDEPVFYKGEVVGTVKKYSDLLLIFMLKHRRPEVFADKSMVVGPGGGPLQVQTVELTNLKTEQLEQMRKWLEQARSR